MDADVSSQVDEGPSPPSTTSSPKTPLEQLSTSLSETQLPSTTALNAAPASNMPAAAVALNTAVTNSDPAPLKQTADGGDNNKKGNKGAQKENAVAQPSQQIIGVPPYRGLTQTKATLPQYSPPPPPSTFPHLPAYGAPSTQVLQWSGPPESIENLYDAPHLSRELDAHRWSFLGGDYINLQQSTNYPVFPTSNGRLQNPAQYGAESVAYDSSGGEARWSNAPANLNGVLGWSEVPPSDNSTPVLPTPAPSAAVSASHRQENIWKRKCLSVTCVLLPSVEDVSAEDSVPDSASSPRVGNSDGRAREVKRPRTETTSESVKATASPAGKLPSTESPLFFERLVWQWLERYALETEVEELVSPGGQRVLVSWFNEQSVMRWEMTMKAAGLYETRQTTFGKVALTWS